MGCCLSAPPDVSPQVFRDLKLAAEGGQSLLVPPRVVKQGIGWSHLSHVHLLSSSGGSCDVYAAVLDSEAVAVKKVKAEATESIRDLHTETSLLEMLGSNKPHRHIIRLVATGVADDGLPFVVLERLTCTLAELLPKPVVRAMDDLPSEPDEVTWWTWYVASRQWPLLRALHVAYQLALALRHLHDDEPLERSSVLHRDLKPDNIGFLPDGTLVLFDFGLATIWPWSQSGMTKGERPGVEAPRALTGQTGSTRYMSPEVALSRPYNGRAEVFSFATILWQLVSHQRPFRGFNVRMFEARVARDGERPKLPTSWPLALRELLRDCWHPEPLDRPCFGEVTRRLEELLKGVLAKDAASSSRGRQSGWHETSPVSLVEVEVGEGESSSENGRYEPR